MGVLNGTTCDPQCPPALSEATAAHLIQFLEAEVSLLEGRQSPSELPPARPSPDPPLHEAVKGMRVGKDKDLGELWRGDLAAEAQAPAVLTLPGDRRETEAGMGEGAWPCQCFLTLLGPISLLPMEPTQGGGQGGSAKTLCSFVPPGEGGAPSWRPRHSQGRGSEAPAPGTAVRFRRRGGSAEG